jgi:hypothetical protein
MENNVDIIVWQIGAYIEDLKMNYAGTIEDIEIASVNAVADDLLKDMKPDEIKKAMINMYFAGQFRNIK